MEFKLRVVESYPELFEESIKDGTESDGITGFGAKWGWYQSVFALASGNIERFEHITKLKATECFTMLAFMKEKNELETNQIKNIYK